MKMDKKSTILIVDDEDSIRDMVQLALQMAGFDCLQAANARDAQALILDSRPDLVLLDWMMPETNGYELLRRLRNDELTRDMPVIMLTARAEEGNKVHGLEGGADDYITKPFAPRELTARIKALLRRLTPSENEPPLQVEGLTLDPLAHRVYADGTPLQMGPTEFNLLHFLMSNPDRAYSRSQLLDHVWGTNVYVEERTVDVHVGRLRRSLRSSRHKLQDYGGFVQTVRGAGYRFSAAGCRVAANSAGH